MTLWDKSNWTCGTNSSNADALECLNNERNWFLGIVRHLMSNLDYTHMTRVASKVRSLSGRNFLKVPLQINPVVPSANQGDLDTSKTCQISKISSTDWPTFHWSWRVQSDNISRASRLRTPVWPFITSRFQRRLARTWGCSPPRPLPASAPFGDSGGSFDCCLWGAISPTSVCMAHICHGVLVSDWKSAIESA